MNYKKEIQKKIKKEKEQIRFKAALIIGA